MGKEFLNFWDTKIERQMFHSTKSTIDIGDVNTDNLFFGNYPCTKMILRLLMATKKLRKLHSGVSRPQK